MNFKRPVPVLLATALMLACTGGLNEHDRLLRDEGLRRVPGPNNDCQEADAVIPVNGSKEGEACSENKAVVNGSSWVCVAENGCNTAKRLAETNAVSEAFCKDWCAKKKCGYDYRPRAKCNSDWCLKSDYCQTNCSLPMRDACYFQEPAPNWNCFCTSGDNPTAEFLQSVERVGALRQL